MREGTAPLIRREDYAAPPYWIRSVDLSFDLDLAVTIAVAILILVAGIGDAGNGDQRTDQQRSKQRNVAHETSGL